MINVIQNEFAYLKEKGYQLNIEEITYIFKQINYIKPNAKIIFECELMEYQFDVEIWVRYGDKEFSICEWIGRRKLFYENKGIYNIINKSIFEYTKGVWDEKTFQDKKEEIYRKKFGFNKSKKMLLEFINLYKELLIVAINNIENFYDIH
jgi:hypothetical protein